MASHRIPRRVFLKRAAVAGGAVIAAGAGGFGVKELLSGGGGLSAVPSPDPTTVDTTWPIKRVVYVMLENRSFNHMFAGFPGARNTSRVALVDGKEVPMVAA